MNFDEFTKEYERIKSLVVAVPAHIDHDENVAGDYLFSCKDLVESFDDAHCRSGAYLYDCYMLANSFDCDYCISSEFLYESENSARCYNSAYLSDCGDMTECFYCVDCNNLKNCFGCIRLENKQYCLFNRQLTKEDYFQKLALWQNRQPSEILAQVERILLTHPVLYKHTGHNENSEHGDYLYHDKNCYFCFDSSHSENCGYMFDTHESKHCYDQTYGFQCEFCYENNDSAFCYSSAFIDYCGWSRNCEFCFNCMDCEYCFGCASLAHKKYCFLNRQLTPEEYHKRVKEVKESMSTQ